MLLETDHPPITTVAQAQLAAIIREAVAPFIEELGQVQRRLGATEQELLQERERRERIEHDHDVAKKELMGLRLLARTNGTKQNEAVERPGDDNVPAKTPNVTPVDSQRESEASQRQGGSWWRRLFGWE